MIYSLSPSERLQLIQNELKEKEKKQSLYFDYYIGGGRQWLSTGNSKGIRTRSGRWLYDLTPELYARVDKYPIFGQSSKLKVYEWGELNILDVVVDETALTLRGFGDNTFTLDRVPDQANEMINDFFRSIGGNVFIQDTGKNCLVYGSDAYLMDKVGANVGIKQIPYSEYFRTDDSFVYSYETIENDKYTKEYTNTMVFTYVNGVVTEEVEHGLGYIPVVDFANNDRVSMIERDIPVQDNVNGFITRVLSCMKDSIAPAMIISDTDTRDALADLQDKGLSTDFPTGVDTVTVLGDNGKASYQSWAGLPNEVMDFMNNIQKIYFAKKGINIFDKVSIPESGEAKKEVRRNLYNKCQYLRDSMDSGFNTMAKLYMYLNGYEQPFDCKMNWAEMVEMSGKEKRELAMMDYTVHNNRKRYLADIGYSEEEIDEIIVEEVFESII